MFFLVSFCGAFAWVVYCLSSARRIRYLPYSFFIIGCATSVSFSLVIHPFLYAISSRQATFCPWRFSITSMNVLASESESCVPVSSHAKPRCRVCTFSSPRFRYSWFTVVISSSPRALGLMFFAISTTLFG